MSIVAVGIALAKNVFALHVSVWRALMNGRAPGGSAGYLNQVVNHLIDELERLDRRMAPCALMIREIGASGQPQQNKQ